MKTWPSPASSPADSNCRCRRSLNTHHFALVPERQLGYEGKTKRVQRLVHTAPFNGAVEAAERLSPEEQQDLVEILQRRLAEAGRQRVAADVQAARREFAAGKTKAASLQEILREIP
jgi:hypothetical protein